MQRPVAVGSRCAGRVSPAADEIPSRPPARNEKPSRWRRIESGLHDLDVSGIQGREANGPECRVHGLERLRFPEAAKLGFDGREQEEGGQQDPPCARGPMQKTATQDQAEDKRRRSGCHGSEQAEQEPAQAHRDGVDAENPEACGHRGVAGRPARPEERRNDAEP